MSLATTSSTTFNFQKHCYAVQNKPTLPWISTTKLEYHSSTSRRGVGLLSISGRGRRAVMMDLNALSNLSSGSPIPSGPPFPEWSNWMLLTIIPIVIPLLTNKWGPLIALKQKLDTSLDEVQDIAETIEDVARKVDNITDKLQENLPKDSKFRSIVERIDNIAEETIKGADLAEELLQKIEDTSDEMEDIIKQSRQKKAEAAQEMVPQERKI